MFLGKVEPQCLFIFKPLGFTPLAKTFALRGVPTSILFDKNGNEFARIIGSINFEDESFVSWIKKYN